MVALVVTVVSEASTPHRLVLAAPPARKPVIRRSPVDCAADRAADRAIERSKSAERPKPFDSEKLAHAFRGKREDARMQVLDEIERLYLDDPAVPEALWRVIARALKWREVPASLIYALQLYSQTYDPLTDERLITLLAAIDLRVVLEVIDVLGERRRAATLPRLVAVQEHPAYRSTYALRHAVVSSVSRFNELASIDFLVATISSLDGQLKYLAAVQLVRLTGENFGANADAWREWWQSRRDEFRVPANVNSDPPTTPLDWDYPVPRFYGTPVYAKRVVFVVDRSKGMLSGIEGVSRLDNTAKQLEEAIRLLPDDAWFEIIAYNSTILPFAGKLVPASLRAKSEAVRFAYSLSGEGVACSYDALAEALRVDANIEAILFVSNGDPSGGTIVERPEILTAIAQQNKPLRATLHVVGIDASGISEEFLKDLAADNFGMYRLIR
jgi:hypothetical protein